MGYGLGLLIALKPAGRAAHESLTGSAILEGKSCGTVHA